MSITNAEIDFKIAILFLNEKKIYFSISFLYDFVRPKTSDKLSINIHNV